MPFNEDQFVFLRTMGHELRTPLNSIVATSEMMVNAVYGELQPGQMKASQRVLRNSNRLLNLINQVMLYIRAQAGALELVSIPVDLAALLKDQISKHQERASAKNLTLELTIGPGSSPEQRGDPDHIAFIVNELLDNAIAFTTAGRVQIEAAPDGEDRWTLRVSDTGMGIAPENTGQVLVPFWRGTEAKQIVPEGNGLGLSIVNEFVRMMGGNLTIESTAGMGTTVTINLPRVIPAHNEAMLPQNAAVK